MNTSSVGPSLEASLSPLLLPRTPCRHSLSRRQKSTTIPRGPMRYVEGGELEEHGKEESEVPHAPW